MDPQRCGPEPQALDEVSRQRNKRRANRMNQLVPGLRDITFGQLAERAASAGDDGPDADTVTEFLRCRRHSDQTIERVLHCLELGEPRPPEPGGAVAPLVDPNRGAQRFRTLAQLEALLLDD
ncbi:MAG TPA: hypothetical protein VEG38_21775 [Acidimicrobiia bacterium]|nr:hypothetical protein [Acidimicrobiia bacterium]